MSESVNRSVFEELLHIDTVVLDDFGRRSGFDQLGSSSRDKNLVASHVARCGVVTSVGDAP